MSSSPVISTDKTRPGERRSFSRGVLNHYVVLVYFGEDNWGKLTNMSEGGMAFEFSRSPGLHERINFTFQVMGCMPMPHDASVLGESFEATGEIVWLREFERTAGVQFVDLAEGNRKHIRQWLSFEASTNTVAATESAREEMLPLAAEKTDLPLPLATLAREPETASEAETNESVVELDTPESPAEPVPVREPEPPRTAAVPEVPEFPLPGLAAQEETSEWQPNVASSPASQPSVARLTFLVVAGCLAAFAVTVGVRVFMAREARRADVVEGATGGANVPSADPSLGALSDAAPPFQIEVLDEAGKRWMLWFVRKDSQKANDPIPRRGETEFPGFSASPARVAKEKDTPQGEDLGSPHTYTLEAPVLSRPAGNGSAPNSPAEEAPAIQKEPAVAQEDPTGGVLNSRVTPPPLQVPVGGMVQQARLIHSVPPIYPSLAKLTRVSGDVVVDALIDSSGNVKTAKVLSGPSILQQAAIETVRQWKYEPARLDGQAVAMHLSVTVKFRLN